MYLDIYHNRNFYIFYDRDPEYESSRVLANFKEEGDLKEKRYFEDLFKEEKNMKFEPLLEEIFPSVLLFQDKPGSEYKKQQIRKNNSSVSRDKRICSGKYFELYFTETENEFVIINKIIESFVNNFNGASAHKEREELFKEMICKLEGEQQREAFNLIQIYLNDVKEEAFYDFLIILFQNIESIDNRYLFLKKSARERTLLIINDLLQLISDKEFEKFINLIERDYNKLQILRRIIGINNDQNVSDNGNRISTLNNLLVSMANEIFKAKINLYLDTNYMRHNIWGLYFGLQERREDFSHYIDQVMSGNNIFRILYDVVNMSFSHLYIYSINAEQLSLMTTTEKVDSVLIGVKPKNDDEKFILEIYKKFKAEAKVDVFNDSGVSSITQKELFL